MLRDRAGAQQVGGKERGKTQPWATALEPVTHSIQTYEEREQRFVQKRTCDSQGLPEQAEANIHRATVLQRDRHLAAPTQRPRAQGAWDTPRCSGPAILSGHGVALLSSHVHTVARLYPPQPEGRSLKPHVSVL